MFDTAEKPTTRNAAPDSPIESPAPVASNWPYPAPSSRAPAEAGLGGNAELQAATEAGRDDADSPLWVPIRELGERHRARIRVHLLALDESDRYLRFGYMASDAQIERYVNAIDFEHDAVFGIFNRNLELVAMAHLAPGRAEDVRSCAEFGVSVLSHARGKGLGSELFERAVVHARNKGIKMLFIHALSENTAMLKIARNAGARIERDGSESECYLRLPEATLDTQLTEAWNEQMAQMDYQLKNAAKRFSAWLGEIKAISEHTRP